MSACFFLITRILLNVHWSMELLRRSRRRDQQGPDMASSSIITSATFYLEIHDLSIFPVPKRIKALQMLRTKEFLSAQNQSGAQESRRRILPHPSSCMDFQTIIWTVLFKFYAEVLPWLPVISLAVNSSTELSGRRAAS